MVNSAVQMLIMISGRLGETNSPEGTTTVQEQVQVPQSQRISKYRLPCGHADIHWNTDKDCETESHWHKQHIDHTEKKTLVTNHRHVQAHRRPGHNQRRIHRQKGWYVYRSFYASR